MIKLYQSGSGTEGTEKNISESRYLPIYVFVDKIVKSLNG